MGNDLNDIVDLFAERLKRVTATLGEKVVAYIDAREEAAAWEHDASEIWNEMKSLLAPLIRKSIEDDPDTYAQISAWLRGAGLGNKTIDLYRKSAVDVITSALLSAIVSAAEDMREITNEDGKGNEDEGDPP